MQDAFSDEQTVRNYRYGLNDFTQVEKFDISSETIFSLARLHIESFRITPDLIVGFAVTKPFAYGLVGIWMTYATSTGWQVNIKKTLPGIRNCVEGKLPRK